MASKFYGIAAAGRPAIFIGSKDGEVARLLGENGCGFTVATKDGETLMRRLLELAGDSNLCASMGVRARVAFERQWDKDQALGNGRRCCVVSARIRTAAKFRLNLSSQGMRGASGSIPILFAP